MVGKLSDDRLMSGSRIPVLYLWKYGEGHPWSTPNDELRKSIAATRNEPGEHFDIGEPGICGNLLESALIESACEELGLPEPILSPPVIDCRKDHFQVSLDGLTTAPMRVRVKANDLIEIHGGEAEVDLHGPIPIESKVTGDYRRNEILGYRGPIQLQMQMMAVNASFGVLITLYRGIERQIVIYRKDPEMQQRIRELCLDFHDRVQTTTYYDPVNVDDAVRRFSEGGGDVELPDLAGRVERLDVLRQQSKAIEDEIAALQTEIMCEMQDHETAIAGDYQVVWPVRRYKAQAERVVPAKDAYQIRLKTLQIKRIS
jgi:hypothetical protein